MKRYLSPVLCVLRNLLLALVLYSLCRLVFWLGNRELFPGLGGAALRRVFAGGLRFDISALCYTLSPWILLSLLPFRFRQKRFWRGLTKAFFVVPAFFWYALDLADSVYFPYTGRRTTCTVFREFGGDDNLSGIILHETLTHWYLVLLGAAILFVLIRCYANPEPQEERYGWRDYLVHGVILLGCLYPVVGGMRGGFGVTVRPISLNDANLYAGKPSEAGLVLNTAFSIYRTLDAKPFPEPKWYADEAALEQAWTPVVQARPGQELKRRNVVILILESFSAAYSARLSEWQGERQVGYMPFLDSLMDASLVFRHSFANGRLSIDALPSVMCGIPSLVEPFFLTPYAQNTVHGLPEELGRKGWSSAFWHGAQRQSLGLAGFAHNIGFQNEYSRESYNDERDFDGTWGIWDEPFLQYFKRGIDALREPFVASVFTLSSHNPFNIPAQYEGRFPEGAIPMHRCIAYSDFALRRFFEAAAREPWFRNTLFVITGDHTGKTELETYQTAHGRFEIPILFYTPDGSIAPGLREGIAQQTDIKPTVLGYLGYDEPCLSFGCDLLHTADADTWALNYLNGVYQYYKGDHLLLFDGEENRGLYDFRHDRLLQDNLLGRDETLQARLEAEAKAVIQQFLSRMRHDRLTARERASD